MGIVPWEMPYCDWFSDWQAPADNPLLVKYAEAKSSFMTMNHVAPASWQPLPAAYYTAPASTGDWQYHLPKNISWFGTRAGCQEACGAIVGCEYVATPTGAAALPELATECFLGVPGTSPEFWYVGESRWTIYAWSLALEGVEREDWEWSGSTPLVRTANGSCGMYMLQVMEDPQQIHN